MARVPRRRSRGPLTRSSHLHRLGDSSTAATLEIAVGPAWSSFAVAGKFLFTQEQRGPMETVVCYEADTGREVWSRSIEGRLDDPLGGPGPRATPALANGGLFRHLRHRIVLRLNPSTGESSGNRTSRRWPAALSHVGICRVAARR
jgi:outer membrane protein assembly factor BamB